MGKQHNGIKSAAAAAAATSTATLVTTKAAAEKTAKTTKTTSTTTNTNSDDIPGCSFPVVTSNTTSITKTRKPWRKNLYENTEYEDNYTDPSFLKDLRTNSNVLFFTYKEAVQGVTVLNNQITCVSLFLITFYLMYSDQISPTTVLLPNAIATALGYVFYCGQELRLKDLLEDSKTLLTVLVFGYIFSPLLHTLTEAISTDTIFTMTFFVLLLNLIFCDYGLAVAMVSKALSLNAAIFGSICLASRLATSYHAFVLLVISAIFFVLYPVFVTRYWRSYFLIPLFIICCYFLYKISQPVLCIYVMATIFINFICTWIFVRMQHHKYNINGPWDEAIVEETTDTNLDEKL